MPKKKGNYIYKEVRTQIEHISEFLDLEISVLEKMLQFPISAIPQIEEHQSEYTWTSNKSDLIEVLEAIHILESINGGNVKSKASFIKYMGQKLNVDLRNHSGLLNDILNRYDDPNQENPRAFYLNKMIDALSGKLQVLDNSNAKRK